MIAQTQLSPSQRTAVEPQAGRRENIDGMPKTTSAAERENAVHQMRSRLALLDASQRRLSIGDSMALMLGDTGTELPA
jgi:hypothetical protein